MRAGALPTTAELPLCSTTAAGKRPHRCWCSSFLSFSAKLIAMHYSILMPQATTDQPPGHNVFSLGAQALTLVLVSRPHPVAATAHSKLNYNCILNHTQGHSWPSDHGQSAVLWHTAACAAGSCWPCRMAANSSAESKAAVVSNLNHYHHTQSHSWSVGRTVAHCRLRRWHMWAMASLHGSVQQRRLGRTPSLRWSAISNTSTPLQAPALQPAGSTPT